MKKIAVYFSPHASSVSPKRLKNDIQKSLFRYNVFIREPKNIDDFTRFIEEDIQNNVKDYFIAGGDGTINLLTQKLHPHPVKIHLLPYGTANDLASELRISNDLRTIIKLFKHNSTKDIDVLNVNGIKFLTSGGMGFAAEVSESVNQYRKNFSWFKKTMSYLKGNTYGLVLLHHLVTKPLKVYELEIKSPALVTPLIIKSPMVLINNQPTIGQDFKLAPGTKNNDQSFTVSVVKDTDKIKLAQTLYQLRVHNQINPDGIFQFNTDYVEINIISGEESLFLGDGEDLVRDKRFKISIEPDQLTVAHFNDSLVYSHSYDLDEVEML